MKRNHPSFGAAFLLLAGCADLTCACAEPSVPSWSIQYEGKIVRRGKDYHVVDLFDVSDADLKALRADGTRPIAYFSSQFEKWRPDASRFPAADLGKKLGGWPGERWVNPKSEAVREIMRERIHLAKRRGFHGIDVDNVDLYEATTGFDNSRAAALDYIRFLAGEAHGNGLKFSLKNAAELARSLSGEVDFYQKEEGIQYDELGFYKGIGKPVFDIEYKRPKKGVPGIYTIFKNEGVMDGREEVIFP